MSVLKTSDFVPGQLPGTRTNDNASSGNVGEYLTVSTPNPGNTSTVTMTIATPGVVTWVGHPFSGPGAAAIVFTTTGALPTGVTASTTYWVIGSTISGNTFQIATSAANAIAGTAIATSGSQSGTHTGTAGSPLSSGANTNVAALSLTAGDWDISVLVGFLPNAATSITQIVGSWSTASATLGALGQLYVSTINATVTGANQSHCPLPTFRLSLAATTTVYVVANSTFTVNVNTAFGFIGCRRAR